MRILHSSLPIKPWMHAKTRKLPGIQPVSAGDWLRVDEVFAQQMAYRDQLISQNRDQVFMEQPNSAAAQKELLAVVLAECGGQYQHSGRKIIRPDGVCIPLEGPPILTAGRLVQEDLILLEQHHGEAVMTAAILCFPASWTLHEKFGGGLVAIHGQVDEYDPDMAKRVQRMFDVIRPEQPLWRANFLIYQDPDLFQPRRAGLGKPRGDATTGFVRVERQTMRKLPETKAVVFGIHSYVMPLGNLSGDEKQGLLRALDHG